MRRRWYIYNLRPAEIVYSVLQRASKYKILIWPDCRPFIESLCKCYSKQPERTRDSLIPSHLLNEQLFIKDGHVINQRDAELQKEMRLWNSKLESGLESFWHNSEVYCKCNRCGMYEIECFSHTCVECSKKEMKLYNKEREIKEIKSIINKVKKICQNQSKQQAI